MMKDIFYLCDCFSCMLLNQEPHWLSSSGGKNKREDRHKTRRRIYFSLCCCRWWKHNNKPLRYLKHASESEYECDQWEWASIQWRKGSKLWESWLKGRKLFSQKDEININYSKFVLKLQIKELLQYTVCFSGADTGVSSAVITQKK